MRKGPVAQGAWPADAVAEVVVQRLDVPREEAREIAGHLQVLFASEERIEDAELERADRALLWRLQAEGIVTTGLEVRPNPEHGRPWRYYQWELVPPQRLLESEQRAASERKVPPEIQVYDALPAETWARNRAAVH